MRHWLGCPWGRSNKFVIMLTLNYKRSIISQSNSMQPGCPQGENFTLNSHFSVLGERNKGFVGKKITKTYKTSNLQTYFNDL